MKLYYSALVVCALIAQISAREINEEHNETSELPFWYTDLVTMSKESPETKALLDNLECMRTEMKLSLEQMYNVFIHGSFKYENSDKKSLQSLPQTLKWACPKLHPLSECQRNYQEVKKNTKSLELIPIWEKMLKFFCDQNDGEMIVQFMTDVEEEDCKVYQDKGLIACLLKVDLSQLQYPTPEFCSQFLEAQTCAKTILKEKCASRRVAEIFLIGTTELYNQVKCNIDKLEK